MNLPSTTLDDHIIVKFGLTDNLDRRTGEHMRDYGKIPNVHLELMRYCYVDPKYLSRAEVYIKEYFEDTETFVRYKNHVEIISMDPKRQRQMDRAFDNIQCKFSGCVKGLIEEVEQLKQNIVQLKERHSWQLKDKDRQLEIKEHIIVAKDQTIYSRNVELENVNLKLELANIRKQ